MMPEWVGSSESKKNTVTQRNYQMAAAVFLSLLVLPLLGATRPPTPSPPPPPPPPAIRFACGDLLAVDGDQNFAWTFLDAVNVPGARPLVGGPYALLFGGRWLSSADGSLQLVQAALGNGSDAHGPFTQLALGWRPASPASAAATATPSPSPSAHQGGLWTTSFRCYGSSNRVVFSQRFPGGLNDAPGGPRDFDRPSSRFPSFDTASLSGTSLSGSISTVFTVLGWICVGIHSRRALPCPVCA